MLNPKAAAEVFPGILAPLQAITTLLFSVYVCIFTQIDSGAAIFRPKPTLNHAGFTF